MKVLNTKQVKQLQRRLKRQDYFWYEGIPGYFVYALKFGFKPQLKYYWKEGDSYIFHSYGSIFYYCITKKFYDSIKEVKSLSVNLDTIKANWNK